MSIKNLSDSQLKDCQKQLEAELVEIIRELSGREKARELERRKQLVPDWDEKLRLSFLEGFETGVRWDANYTPGGPYISQPSTKEQFQRTDMTLGEFNARAELSRLQHEEWMRGFQEGRPFRRRP